MANRFPVSSRQLPDISEPQMNFLGSSFFKNYGLHDLPDPPTVKQLAQAVKNPAKPPPIVFENLGLIVKYGPCVTKTEAQNLWLIRHTLGDEVPVPEVYAWRTHGSEVFIYMQVMQGTTLRSRWDSLNAIEKSYVCHQIKHFMIALRGLKQDQEEQFIGSVNGQRLQDYVFEQVPENKPFPSVALFNDWFSSLPEQRLLESQKYVDPYRCLLPDNGAITFTHADLHRSNIIVSGTAPIRVVAIVDWGQSGWYPEYWEYCKAQYTTLYTDEWGIEWIPRFLSPRDEEYEAFGEYTMAIGAV